MRENPARQILRGFDLDVALERELASMLSDGFALSPISIPALTKRLGLKSRSTLHIAARKKKIQNALAEQKSSSGVIFGTKNPRRSEVERIKMLEKDNENLQRQVDHHIEMMCRIVANATAKGWDVEYLLKPLGRNWRELV